MPFPCATDVNHLKAFFNRLEKAQNRELNEKLAHLITPKDYHKIVDYFIKPQNKIVIEPLYSLQPGEAYRFDKKVTGLPRTVNVLCSPNGELKLIVETKSKLANNTKQTLPSTAGAFKSGKPAWRIDSKKEIEYFNLVATLNADNTIQAMKNEAALSQYFASDHIDTLELGQPFLKKDSAGNTAKTKISAYSLRANEDLRSLLLKKGKSLTKEQKEQMMLDLLTALKIVGKHGFVHQDIKPENILVYGNDKEGYQLKISDFGMAAKEGIQKLGCTPGYQPPEISPHWKNDKRIQNSLGYSIYIQSPDSFQDKETTKKTSDTWAMGIVLCEILYDFKPTSHKQLEKIEDPIIKGLLHPDKEKRLTPDNALHMLKERIRSRYQSRSICRCSIS